MERKTKKEKAFYVRSDRAITLIALIVTKIVHNYKCLKV